MGEHHPLGMSGRARGVEQAGQGAGVRFRVAKRSEVAARTASKEYAPAAGSPPVKRTCRTPSPSRTGRERGPAVGIGDQDPGAESATTWRTSSGCSAALTTFGTAPAFKAPR